MRKSFRKRYLLGLLALIPLIAQGPDIGAQTSAQTFAVVETGFTNITNPLPRANFFQIYITPSGTAQVYTIRNVNGSTMEIASGASFEFGPLRSEFAAGTVICSIQTDTAPTNIQLVAMRVQ